MAIIALEGMRFYAYHGFYEEEQIIGNDYLVDVFIKTQITKAAVEDNLAKTINYETLHLICETVMRKKYKLLETVAERIALGIKHQFSGISEMRVRVKKINPPLGSIVDSASVEVDGVFEKKCSRCNKPMLCYGDKSCWCMDTLVHKKTLESLKSQFGDKCLCKECIGFFAG